MPINYPCFELCLTACLAAGWETGPLVSICLIGCAFACDENNPLASNGNSSGGNAFRDGGPYPEFPSPYGVPEGIDED